MAEGAKERQRREEIQKNMRDAVEAIIREKVAGRKPNISATCSRFKVPRSQYYNVCRAVRKNMASADFMAAFNAAEATDAAKEKRSRKKNGKGSSNRKGNTKGKAGGGAAADTKQTYGERYMEAGRLAAGKRESVSSLARRLELNRRTIISARDRTLALRGSTGNKSSVAPPPDTGRAQWIPKAWEDLLAAKVSMYASQRLYLPKEQVQADATDLIEGTQYALQFPKGVVGESWYTGFMKRYAFVVVDCTGSARRRRS